MSVKPESVGMCSARLARIDRFLAERYIDSGRLPCAQLQIARGGQLVHQTVLGKASLESGTPLVEDSIVRIYSMTKPITSVAFMMLVEEGLVALEDPVHRFIPSWRNLGVYVGGGVGLPGTPAGWLTRPTDAPMRIVDLLRHTSGLTYGFQNRTNVDAAYRANKIDPLARTDGLQGFVDALAEVPLEFSPGTAWNYSVSADVLGYLVQQISGQPFEQFLQQRIFDPLGMRDTAFFVGDSKASRLAQCYLKGGDGKLIPAQLGSFREPPAAPSGGGGLVSTAADYMRFCECLRRGGELDGARLLGPKTLALMRMNHLPGGGCLADHSVSMFTEATYAGVGFGLGFGMTTDVAKTQVAGSQGEYWWGGAASTVFWIDPVEDLCVVFLTQFLPSTMYPIRRELRTLINAAVIDSKAA
ncbi:MAG TPA: serine hydrolase domain-containing protein [Rubrivivax sp.]|nr:serine hydrolase domain-containing protein [Rubrivivax sp.]